MKAFRVEKKNATKFSRWLCWNHHLAVLDETDSGLDIDALRIVADGVKNSAEKKMHFWLLPTTKRLLEYIVPDFVHVLFDGSIVKSGKKELRLSWKKKATTGLRKKFLKYLHNERCSSKERYMLLNGLKSLKLTTANRLGAANAELNKYRKKPLKNLLKLAFLIKKLKIINTPIFAFT